MFCCANKRTVPLRVVDESLLEVNGGLRRTHTGTGLIDDPDEIIRVMGGGSSSRESVIEPFVPGFTPSTAVQHMPRNRPSGLSVSVSSPGSSFSDDAAYQKARDSPIKVRLRRSPIAAPLWVLVSPFLGLPAECQLSLP